MILRIVTRPECWPPLTQQNAQNCLNLPASLPALRSMESQGVSTLRLDQILGKEDFQSIWRESALIVRRMISNWEESPGFPHLVWIHSYSLYLLVAQLMVMERFFERVNEQWGLLEIQMEDPGSFPNGDSLFFEGVYSSYYTAFAQRWAQARGIPVTTIRVFPTHKLKSIGPRAHYFSKHVWRFLWRRFWEEGWLPIWNVYRNLVSLGLGRRRFVFFLPSKGGGMRSLAPPWAIDVRTFRRLCRFPSVGNVPVAPALEKIREAVDRALVGQSEVFSLVRERLSVYLRRRLPSGLGEFYWANRWLHRFKRWGIQVAYLSSSVYVDWTHSGYIAEAFRLNGFPVGGVQHGGNTRLALAGGTPSLYAEYGLCNVFFQWGSASFDEHIGWGLKGLPRIVITGSPRLDELRHRDIRRKKYNNPSIPLKVLYAPTVMGVDSTMEYNVAWDRYLPLFHQICEVLNSAPLRVIVKLLPLPENAHLGLDRYPKLQFEILGSFADYMEDADLLMVDSLGGSPVYEAIMTNKPFLVYTGSERQEWDNAFLNALCRRALCCFTAEEYLQTVKLMAADPEGFLKKMPSERPISLTDFYFSGVPQDRFWSTVYEGLFQETHP